MRGWDVDFILLEVSPTAIPHFAPWWTLGGSAKRGAPGGRPDPFPAGLELANEPFTLRAQPPEGTTDPQVAAWGKQLLDILKLEAPTGNPTLVPPGAPEVAAKQLALEPRMVGATALARALQHPSLPVYKLFVARYGMKVDAQEFFENHLLEAITSMAEEVGEGTAMARFHNMVVDWATQSTLNGRVLLLSPKPGYRTLLSWPAKMFSYPMFGRMAAGSGGVTLTARPIENPVGMQAVTKVNLYAAGWAHHMKGAGLPPIAVPAQATNAWVMRQRPKLQSIITTLQGIRSEFLGGLRIEVRTNGAIPTWPELQGWLQGVVDEAMSTCLAGEVDPRSLIINAQAGLDNATASGVFSSTPVEAPRQLAPWRRAAYYRLLHLIGIVNPKTAKSSLSADLAGRPWGNPSLTDAASPGTVGVLHVNPVLPPGLPRIPCPSTREASASAVARIGTSLGSNLPWPAICAALHLRPDDAAVFSTVVQRTKWRRFPMGRSRAGLGQFTATALQGGRMVGPLGDHLILATINLVAMGLHDQVQRL